MTYEAMPPVQPGEYGSAVAGRGPAPSSVTMAVRLMFVRAAIGLVSILVAFTQKDALRDIVREQNPDYSSSKLDDAVNAALAITAVIGVVFLVLYILLALQVGKGRNWARIVTWVLAALGLISFLAAIAGDNPGVSKIFAAVTAVLDLAIIVLLAQKPSNDYFRQRAAV
jgi:peptidoglycan/LPS O-acetylase OafA/YrhL